MSETIISGIYTSITVTIIIFVLQYLIKLIFNIIKYNKFNGKYKCFSYKTDNFKDSDPNSNYYKFKEGAEANQNVADLKLRGWLQNKFHIIVKNKDNEKPDDTWTGEIYMKNNNVGDLSWKYISTNKKIGSKEVSFWDQNGQKIIYFIEKFDKKYGREILFKKD